MFAGQVLGQGAPVVVARLAGLAILLWFVAAVRLLTLRLVLGFNGGQGLRQVFEGELQLIRGESLGTPAELMALQLHDDRAQPIAFSKGAVELRSEIVQLSLVGIPLGLQRQRFA